MELSRPHKLGILTTHPIQYQVPWFRELAARSDVDLAVFYCLIPDPKQQGEGFGVEFMWDVPLLDGYPHEILKNVSRDPSVTAWPGCDTPGIDRIVRSGGYDAFISNGWIVKSCFQLLAACRRHGVPCIVRGESNTLRRRPWWKRLVHRALLRRYAAFLSIGRLNRDFYLANGVPEEKIFWTPYCVENDRFRRAAAKLRESRARLRREWKVPDQSYTFLFCGKLIPKKRPLDLLEALEQLRSRDESSGEGVHLLVVGDGRLRRACEQFAESRRLPVTFVGFINQGRIREAYAVSDCLVLPSDEGETWGLVVNEAMACGLPAIVSDRVGCHPDLVLPGKTGEVFPVGDTDSLAARMSSLAWDRGRSRETGRRAEEHVARYSYAEVVRGTVAALHYVKPRRPA